MAAWGRNIRMKPFSLEIECFERNGDARHSGYDVFSAFINRILRHRLLCFVASSYKQPSVLDGFFQQTSDLGMSWLITQKLF